MNQREIKFRVWDNVNKKWLWTGFEKYVSETHEDKPQDVRKGNFWLTPQWVENANAVSFQQFTGLKDKNGKDIYEGDIFKWGNFIGVVKFQNGCFVFDTNDNYSMIMRDHSPEEFEVIGNIHENPELLK